MGKISFFSSGLFASAYLLMSACSQPVFDVQGHRGSRGLMPENSIPAFIHAIDLGVTTLEMDVVITQDSQVVVSHEPFMSNVICTDPDGHEMLEGDGDLHNIYQMTYEEVAQYDCGNKNHPDFPLQKKLSVAKPLLSEVIHEVENYLEANNLPPVNYNIETKSSQKGDNVYHPEPARFVDLLYRVIDSQGVNERTTIQSFDERTLQYAHQAYPKMSLVILVEEEKNAAKIVELLGFTPEVYSPYHLLVDAATVDFAHENGMKIIPWTVNEEVDIQKMLALGVDGIISDYPNRVIEAVRSTEE